MPVRFDQMNAKISNYQDNGPLNALVHGLVAKMADMPDAPMGDGVHVKNQLLAAFQAEWDTSLGANGWARLEAVLRGQGSMEREILLGPVLRRMLPADENLPQLSDESVARLAKRFGIRAEFYEDFAGMKARIRETIARNRPGLNAVQLEAELGSAFKAEVSDELRALVENDPNNPNLGRDQIEAKLQAEHQRIEDGLLPSYAREPVDTLGNAPERLTEADPRHRATLRVYRKEAKGGVEYRFGASNHVDPNVSSIDTASHNYNSYTTNPVYEQTAPRLRPLLQSAVRKTIEDRPQGSPVDVGTLVDNVSKIFASEDPKTAKAGANQQGSTADGFMGGLLSGVETFFKPGIFNSVKGIWDVIKSVIESMMGTILGFQEKIMERDRQPGDPLTKKEREENPALSKAANSFSIWVKSLGEAIAAQHLNEAWRANPDSTEAWVGLIEALVEDGQLSEADACLCAQEKRMLESMEALKKEAQAEGQNEDVRIIQGRIDEYRVTVAPLEENAEVRQYAESIGARLTLFKEVNAQVQAFSKTHQALKETVAANQRIQAEQALLQAERQAVIGLANPELVARLEKLHVASAANQDKIAQLGQLENVALRQAPSAAVLQQFTRQLRAAQERQLQDAQNRRPARRQ